MADGQTFDAVGELQKRYPGTASEPSEKAQAYLSEPQNFRSAFPEYAQLDDDTIRRNMAPPKAQPSFWQRLKSSVTPPPELPAGNEFSVGAGEARATGSTQPLRHEQALASTLAGTVAGMGDSPMGMPRANLLGLATDTASVAGETGKAIGRGLKNIRLRPQEAPAPDPTALAGTPTSAFRGEGLTVPPPLPEAALPAMAKGVMASTGDMTSTGALPAQPLGTPPAPPPLDPVAAAIKQGIAAKLPTRMPKPAAPPTPEPELGSPENPGWVAKLPDRMPAPKAAAIAKGLGDISPRASEPNFTGSEGRPATWTNETVTKLAGQGNRDAISQAIRRGLGLPENARYVMGDANYPRAVLNPRETTIFSPDGTPIRNADNPLVQNPSSKARITEMPPARVETPAPAAPRAPSPENLQTAMRAARGIPEEAKPQTQGGMVTQRAPRAKAVPVTQSYAPDIIEQAENEMRGALELGQTMPQAGRYFAENTYEEHPLAGRYNVKAGERPGGTWSGIGSQKGNIAGQYPWFNDPEISVSKLQNAIQQGKGALYERIVGKIAEGIIKERGAATAAISEQIPQLRELAGQVQEVEPELAQALNDLADGKIGLAPDRLRAYVTEKISDATAAAQFSREIDDAAAEARSASPEETNAAPNPARPGSGKAGPAAQAPELSTKPLGHSSKIR